MCACVQSDVLHVLRVLRVPVFQFCKCLWRHVFGVLRVLCVLLGLYVLYALCALYAFSKPYVQHRGPQKRASGQKRTDGSQRTMLVLSPHVRLDGSTPSSKVRRSGACCGGSCSTPVCNIVDHPPWGRRTYHGPEGPQARVSCPLGVLHPTTLTPLLYVGGRSHAPLVRMRPWRQHGRLLANNCNSHPH